MPMSRLEPVDRLEDFEANGGATNIELRRRWYALDDADQITRVSHGWADLGNRLLGRTIWNFFSGTATHHIYRNIFQRVRNTEASTSVDIRCDQPNQLVELRVVVSGSANSELLVTIETLLKAPTEYQSLWDPDVVRSTQLVRACSWCQSIHVRDDLWLPFVEAVGEIGLLQANYPPDISHGICKDCFGQLDINE